VVCEIAFFEELNLCNLSLYQLLAHNFKESIPQKSDEVYRAES
jgi:hypothetical protein